MGKGSELTDRCNKKGALCAGKASGLKFNAANNAEQTKSESLRRCNR